MLSKVSEQAGLTRVALGVEYHGSDYNGWQSQPHEQNTIQQTLEQALAQIAAVPVRIFCAGRTDAGVHATGQVVHFDTPEPRSLQAWVRGTNTHLPATIRVCWAKYVSDEFHARFSAMARRYIYVIDNRPVRSAIMTRHFSFEDRPLAVDRMQQAARYLEGEHDFSSYRTVKCQAKSPVKRVHHLKVEQRGSLISIDIKANAFLHHMVRNVAGVLMAVGMGKAEPGWAREVLEARDRTVGGVTAPPHGLYLVEVDYPAGFELPTSSLDLPFFP
ncbi:MAG: tRNA pseudouridine(38-40) synthase TruA [Anaerolineae bacterium]|nr:tRNA pseudouridine(38-40) synthase TruA [Anaerolineae bacterium]